MGPATADGSRARLIRHRSDGLRWEMALRRPPPPLQRHVREYCGYAEAAPALIRRRELPIPRVVVIFDLGPPLRLADGAGARRHEGGFVAGVGDAPTETEHDGRWRGVQIDMSPIGARLVFGVPMAELAGRDVALSELLIGAERDLPDRLRERATWDARFDLLDRFFLRRLVGAGPPHPAISWAVDRLEASRGAADIAGMARELGYSSKHLIRLFREHVGLPPKRFARLVRFHGLVAHLRQGGGGGWADIAPSLAYYDQAHLVREVRRFAGATPTELRAMVGPSPALPIEAG